MIQLSKVTSYTEIPVMVSQPEEIIGHEVEKNFSSCLFFEEILISRHPKKIKIWDLKKLPEIQMISSIEIDWAGESIKKYGNLLYVGQNDHIKVFDLADITNPILVRTIKLPKYVNFHVADELLFVMIEKAIYTIDEKDVLVKIIDLSSYNPMMFGYPMDMKKVANNLFMAFRHCGLYAYTQSEETGTYEFKCNDKPVHGYTPTYIQWQTEGEQMLLLGNDNVVQYNVSNTSKLKRYKAAKIKTVDICEGLVERDNELLVLGKTASKSKFVVAVLSSDENGIKVLQTPKLEYKPRVKFGESPSGIAVKDDYLLIVGRETGFFLFEAGA
ncbi:hypothetical protein [Flavobacterium piscis]|uniref:WD40 repeat domain-containing protein n=1 Tax=Flavobacterium piscis TaxID=1114874 RepID=A0ABU1YCV3_9FLAO|nr:hypothetical protein [Flavobacterium piscis]MDR7212064.1 hypothetical protein [Flavobacterium piscis]